MQRVSILILLFFNQLLIAQSTQVLPDVKSPSWVNKRPVNSFKYVGIGFAEKNNGSNYQNEAKKNALYDLTSEIKVNISTNSILQTVQNNNQFNENFNSLIKLSNTDNIEGYRLVDSYENDKQYWLYYELDKQEYENQKLKKKQLAISKASNLIDLSFNDEQAGNFTSSLKKRIHAFGILSSFLNEEVILTSSNNVKTVIDLSNLIQKQLQSITLLNSQNANVLKPYQASYKPITYRLITSNQKPLADFPFIVKTENEQVRIFESAATTPQGDLEISVKTVAPCSQDVLFTINPDIQKLMENDSAGKSSITLLKQFIETSQLKASISVKPITVFISCKELNLSKAMDKKMVEPIIEGKFNGQEVRVVETPQTADYIIEVSANTLKDVSSDALSSNYGLQLAMLKINLALRNTMDNEMVYKTEVTGIYGYANTLENAGINAYYSDKLKIKMSEALFFLKRKMIVY